jgi:hypothetical protein
MCSVISKSQGADVADANQPSADKGFPHSDTLLSMEAFWTLHIDIERFYWWWWCSTCIASYGLCYFFKAAVGMLLCFKDMSF